LQAGGHRFEPVHLHQSGDVGLVGDRRLRSKRREPGVRRTGTKTRQRKEMCLRRILCGCRRALLMANRKEASCVTEAVSGDCASNRRLRRAKRGFAGSGPRAADGLVCPAGCLWDAVSVFNGGTQGSAGRGEFAPAEPGGTRVPPRDGRNLGFAESAVPPTATGVCAANAESGARWR
jgi:hypothetical protein